MLDEKLESKEMTYKCRVLKKVIKSEDEEGVIERIEFNSDPKVIKKFLKRQSKCKIKKDRAKKTGLREKMLQMDAKVEFKQPLPPMLDKLNQSPSQNARDDSRDNSGVDLGKTNTIKISMDEQEVAQGGGQKRN